MIVFALRSSALIEVVSTGGPRDKLDQELRVSFGLNFMRYSFSEMRFWQRLSVCKDGIIGLVAGL